MLALRWDEGRGWVEVRRPLHPRWSPETLQEHLVAYLLAFNYDVAAGALGADEQADRLDRPERRSRQWHSTLAIAPDFSTVADDGRPVTSADLIGRPSSSTSIPAPTLPAAPPSLRYPRRVRRLPAPED